MAKLGPHDPIPLPELLLTRGLRIRTSAPATPKQEVPSSESTFYKPQNNKILSHQIISCVAVFLLLLTRRVLVVSWSGCVPVSAL